MYKFLSSNLDCFIHSRGFAKVNVWSLYTCKEVETYSWTHSVLLSIAFSGRTYCRIYFSDWQWLIFNHIFYFLYCLYKQINIKCQYLVKYEDYPHLIYDLQYSAMFWNNWPILFINYFIIVSIYHYSCLFNNICSHNI